MSEVLTAILGFGDGAIGVAVVIGLWVLIGWWMHRRKHE